MEIYSSSLPKLPEPPDYKSCLASLEFRFGRDQANTEVHLVSAASHNTNVLAKLAYQVKQEGPVHLKGHWGYFSLTIPNFIRSADPVRLHIAVPYLEAKDLGSQAGVKHSQDFDRLLDIVQAVLQEMVEAAALAIGRQQVEIVAEPLSLKMKPKINSVDFVSFAIGATWLRYQERDIFNQYSFWDPRKGEWKREADA